jgi:hypothetical protein
MFPSLLEYRRIQSNKKPVIQDMAQIRHLTFLHIKLKAIFGHGFSPFMATDLANQALFGGNIKNNWQDRR